MASLTHRHTDTQAQSETTYQLPSSSLNSAIATDAAYALTKELASKSLAFSATSLGNCSTSCNVWPECSRAAPTAACTGLLLSSKLQGNGKGQVAPCPTTGPNTSSLTGWDMNSPLAPCPQIKLSYSCQIDPNVAHAKGHSDGAAGRH
jgi:hypothetical protein